MDLRRANSITSDAPSFTLKPPIGAFSRGDYLTVKLHIEEYRTDEKKRGRGVGGEK